MTATRSFRIAASLARLVQREAGSSRHREGYYDANADRNAHVTMGEDGAFLVMSGEGRHEVPASHAQALLDVADATAERDRSSLDVGGVRAWIDRYPAVSTDVATFEFASEGDAAAFRPPEWTGQEVTGDARYQGRALASGPPRDAAETVPTNAGLEAILDLVEAIPRRRGDPDLVVVKNERGRSRTGEMLRTGT